MDRAVGLELLPLLLVGIIALLWGFLTALINGVALALAVGLELHPFERPLPLADLRVGLELLPLLLAAALARLGRV